MTSAGYDREVLLLTPPSPKPGLPVLFVWHGLGATAKSMVPRLGLRELAAQGVIVVVPQAHPEADIGWGWTKAREDLVLFDDLRACLQRDLGADLDRVVTSGFSAGGLWSTYLLFHRADSLATAVIMSGGLLPPLLTYSTPASVLVEDDVVWIADQRNGVVRRIEDGVIETVLGGGGVSIDDGATKPLDLELLGPAGLARAPDGTLLIADQLGHRVYAWRGAP